MKIYFTTHGVTESTENVTANVNGELVPATIAAVEVELVSDHYGSLKLKFVGSESAEAKKVFTPGSVHEWTL